MKNLLRNLLIFLIFIFVFFNRSLVINSITSSYYLWINIVFPSIFPILIISDLLLSSNIIKIFTKIFGNIFSKLFRVSSISCYPFLMSLFTGCPSNAKYIKDLLINDYITNNEAVKILSMSMNYNPLLIITLTSFLDYKDRILLIIINILINFLIGLFNRNYYCDIRINNIKSVKFNLIDSISNSINVLLLILGSIVTFNVLSAILPLKHPLLNGIFEITNGINLISDYNFIYKYNFLFTGILLSFGGFSILYQIKSIFKDTLLDYSIFYKSRIIHLSLFLIFYELFLSL